MTRVLIICNDHVSASMGGMGVRNWEIARALADSCEVTLAIPNQPDMAAEGVRLLPFDLQHGDLRPEARQADILIAMGNVLHFHPYLREIDVPAAVDLYVPSLLESLVWHAHDPLEEWIPAYQEYLRIQLELLRYGDFFYCASERQRDYWLGWLNAQKRINPHTYRQDPTLRRLIDVVPFGLPQGAPLLRQPAMKGVIPGIAAGDQVILWSGGLWDWLDPLTPIRAMALLASRHPRLKLHFMGTRHPNPVVSNMSMPERALALSQELGLLNRSVFFGDWVPYAARESYLAEADLALVAHPDHIETRFSFRTRVLDCIWAGLPIVATDGDSMADWIRSEKMGEVTPVGDAAAMAAAIERVLEAGGRPAYASSFENLRLRLRWDRVVEPLRRFCLAPSRAADSGLYLTELERIVRDKDAYINQIIHDKDAYINQIIHDKDAYFDSVVHERDQQIASLSAQLDRIRSLLPVKIYRRIRRLLGLK